MSEIIKLKRGQKLCCPHCEEEYEEPVEDFTIPGRMGLDSMATEMCCYCDVEFTVEQIGPDEFEVNPEP